MSGSAPTSDICLIVRHGSNGLATDLAALPPDLSLLERCGTALAVHAPPNGLGKRVAGSLYVVYVAVADALKLP